MSDQDKNPPQDTPENKPNGSNPSESLPEVDMRQTLFFGASAKGIGATCPKCGHVNRAGVLVCANCATLLVTDPVGGTKRLEEEDADDPQSRTAPTETAEIYEATRTAGSTEFTENMVLRLEIEGAPTPILLHPKAETSIGRKDPATGTQPDVDLSAYAGYRLGVSRKHAIIRLNGKSLEINDLGSSNGTSVNGTRLTPHQPHVLRDGDEVTLGKMSLRVLFQIRNRRP